MGCRKTRKALMDYADGRLPGEAAARVRAHLDDCRECSRAADRLALSRAALASLGRAAMPGEAGARTLEALAERSARPRGATGFLRSPRAVAAAGLVTAVLVSLAIVIGLYTARGPSDTPALTEKSAPEGASSPVSTRVPGESRDLTRSAPAASMVMPVASVTANNYDRNSIESMAKELEVKKEFARRYTLADAVNLRVSFGRRLADDFMKAGGEGPLLEAMISFVNEGEPTLLPCYAEKAFFTGEPVIIIGLAGPPRNGETPNLTRAEFWAFSLEKFLSDPDLSLVWWGQSQE